MCKFFESGVTHLSASLVFGGSYKLYITSTSTHAAKLMNPVWGVSGWTSYVLLCLWVLPSLKTCVWWFKVAHLCKLSRMCQADPRRWLHSISIKRGPRKEANMIYWSTEFILRYLSVRLWWHWIPAGSGLVQGGDEDAWMEEVGCTKASASEMADVHWDLKYV